MSREIGSEFHSVCLDNGQGLELPLSGTLVFSGRTGIETVLKQIPNAKKAMLPSYCCDSMIQPFRDFGIEVGYYPVNFKERLIVEAIIPDDTDIFLWCNYFGFSVPMPDLSGFNGIIIEDITHSLLSVDSYHIQSHYIVASLRKWEPIYCGGYCAALNNTLDHKPTISPPEEFLNLKSSAMKLKADYLSNLNGEMKSRYLSMFGESNQWVTDNYSGLSIDRWSKEYLSNVDVAEQKKIRINNAKTLYEGLKDSVEFLFPEEDMNCPLFVPILLNNRDEVRRVLTANQIYCPVHWPKPEDCESNLYANELSLICDQRYSDDDMERIVCILKSI